MLHLCLDVTQRQCPLHLQHGGERRRDDGHQELDVQRLFRGQLVVESLQKGLDHPAMEEDGEQGRDVGVPEIYGRARQGVRRDAAA